MTRALRLVLLLTLACGGSDPGGPRDANVTGSWILTFSATNTCSLSQISVILSESPSGAPIGTHGAYVLDCPNNPNDPTEPAGPILGWQVSGRNFSLQFSNAPPQRLTGVVADGDGSITGSYVWENLSGTFTATRQ